MALRHAVVGMLVMAAAMLAVAEAAEMTTDCSNLILQMVDCLPYVTNSTVEKPDGNCCSGLKTVLKTKAECLCEAFSSSSQLGITVNVSKAVTLPSACHVHAPSTSKCGISVSPATAPALSPTGAPFSIANPPSIGGVVPAASPTQKGSSSTIRIPVGLILALIVGAIFSSF